MALKVTLENTAFRSSGNTEIIRREEGLKESHVHFKREGGRKGSEMLISYLQALVSCFSTFFG